jgi:NACalpha-BTF3-like transcription factor
MAVHLGPAGKAVKEMVGRNFVLSQSEKRALDLENQRINIGRVSPLAKRITSKAKKSVMDIVLSARNKFLSKEISKQDLMVYAILELDKLIINQLPVSKEAKVKAIESQKREAMLSNIIAEATLGTVFTQSKALNVIRESAELLEKLPPLYKKALVVSGIDTKLNALLHKVKSSKTGEYVFTTPDVTLLKIINTANTRQILGEEMSNVYQQSYTATKMDLVQTMIRMFS